MSCKQPKTNEEDIDLQWKVFLALHPNMFDFFDMRTHILNHILI